MAAIELWRKVLEGSDARVPRTLQDDLPELLWLYFMGVVLFWVYDPTPDGSATRNAVACTAPLVVRAIGLTRLPILRGMVDDLVALINEVRRVFTAPATDPGRRP
ncbi:MAG: hypothetical protein KY450_12850 [Actinobacteria bacterium]|nr:hypothetical protein [Actinomycetota bacterium]